MIGEFSVIFSKFSKIFSAALSDISFLLDDVVLFVISSNISSLDSSVFISGASNFLLFFSSYSFREDNWAENM